MIETVIALPAARGWAAGPGDAAPTRITVLGDEVEGFRQLAAPLLPWAVSPSAAAGGGIRESHLRACVDLGAPEGWLHCADVLYFSQKCADVAEVVRTLRVYPGCAMCVGAIAGERLAVAVRHRARVLLLRGSSRRRLTPAGCAAIGSSLHAWLAAGRCPASLRGVGVGCDPLIHLTLSPRPRH